MDMYEKISGARLTSDYLRGGGADVLHHHPDQRLRSRTGLASRGIAWSRSCA